MNRPAFRGGVAHQAPRGPQAIFPRRSAPPYPYRTPARQRTSRSTPGPGPRSKHRKPAAPARRVSTKAVEVPHRRGGGGRRIDRGAPDGRWVRRDRAGAAAKRPEAARGRAPHRERGRHACAPAGGRDRGRAHLRAVPGGQRFARTVLSEAAAAAAASGHPVPAGQLRMTALPPRSSTMGWRRRGGPGCGQWPRMGSSRRCAVVRLLLTKSSPSPS